MDIRLLPCFFKQTFHFDCPGCGLQRSLLALFIDGDISQAWHYYPPVFFMLITFSLLTLHLIFKWYHGAFLIKMSFILSVLIIVINYIYKILNHQLL